MAIPLAIIRGGLPRAALAGLVAVTALTLALTLSRGGYVGLTAGLVVAAAVLLRGASARVLRRLVSRAAAGILVGLLALAAIGAAWQPARMLVARVAERAATIVDPAESSNQIRLDLWSVALQMTADHPLLGSGPDSYVLVFPQYRDAVIPPARAENLARFRVESPHNVYLAVAAGVGVPGLVAFMTLVGSSLWIGARAAWGRLEREARIVLAGLMGGATVVLVTNLFMTGEPATTAIWFILLGALAGVGAGLRPAISDTPVENSGIELGGGEELGPGLIRGPADVRSSRARGRSRRSSH
ncbi:MAG: O-antigen ligase family protein [Candidatus Limnocylindria bacterium]